MSCMQGSLSSSSLPPYTLQAQRPPVVSILKKTAAQIDVLVLQTCPSAVMSMSVETP